MAKKDAPKQPAQATPKKPAPKPTVAKATKSSSKSAAPAKKTKSPEGGQKALAKKVDAGKPETAPATAAVTETTPQTPQRQSTSRFRRSPSRPKVKGTMVAEFPKRLVIKYRPGSRRDPFETLINEAKRYDNPIEQRVPNVEGLRLVGVIESRAGANRALFEDGDGYGYILKSGDKVRNGYVLRVESDRVFFQIFEYGWSRTVALKIEQ